MSRLNISDALGFMSQDTQFVSVGPIAGNNGGLATGGYTSLPGLNITLAPARPSRALVHYQARFENSALAWYWAYSRVAAIVGTPSRQLKTGGTPASDLKSYYASTSFNQNQGWDYFEFDTPGTYQLAVQAYSASAAVLWSSAVSENYLMALMWPK